MTRNQIVSGWPEITTRLGPSNQKIPDHQFKAKQSQKVAVDIVSLNSEHPKFPRRSSSNTWGARGPPVPFKKTDTPAVRKPRLSNSVCKSVSGCQANMMIARWSFPYVNYLLSTLHWQAHLHRYMFVFSNHITHTLFAHCIYMSFNQNQMLAHIEFSSLSWHEQLQLEHPAILAEHPVSALVHQDALTKRFMGAIQLRVQPSLDDLLKLPGAGSCASGSCDVAGKASKNLIQIFMGVPAPQIAETGTPNHTWICRGNFWEKQGLLL